MGGNAIPAGMKRWDGGDSAPADWDGGAVLLRDKTFWYRKCAWRWGDPQNCGEDDASDIIAYTPKPDAKPGTPAWDSTGGYVNSPRDITGGPTKPVRLALPDDGDRDAVVVEAMARAMAENSNDYDWECAPDRVLQWHPYISDARAALAAYRAHQEAF